MTSGAQRPFRILGLQQIAIGGTSQAALKAFWGDLLGLAMVGQFRSERENVDEAIAMLGSGPFAVEVDLMEPVDPDRSPSVHQPALNHIGLWVDDLPGALAWLAGQGVRVAPGGIRRGAAGHDIAFLHPKGNEAFPIGAGGVLVELVQAPPAVIAAHAP
ncbi:VOC family protein [Pseudoduganella buxea]|uniref:Lactoylglutathione lyase n=1 Tax=Pseudoduganella buxea TaxID=1949069 RepID=A0A6I3T3E2_9BURK|nr:VOC family protein [Pseudoduganella buxea]MTV56148.1 VOC family protein [Pseudoduganella buxea]GGB95610.1 lactoylglutathione lyase [Pseudoduganella buxea]